MRRHPEERLPAGTVTIFVGFLEKVIVQIGLERYNESMFRVWKRTGREIAELYHKGGFHMKEQMKNLKFLFARAWGLSKGYFFLCLVKNLFTGLLPLIHVFGVGIIVDALLEGRTKGEVAGVIVLYLSVNLAAALIRHILSLLDNIAMRKITNIVQYEYMNDCVCVNYHYVQDGSMANLKRKSMKAHPAFFISIWGNFFNYFVQLAGVLFIFSVLSPWFVLIILVISALLIRMSLLTQKQEFDFDNGKVEDDRKLEYLYSVMTEYKFAKEIRINNANQFIQEKYSSIFAAQVAKMTALYRRKFGVQSLSNLLTILQTALMYIYFTWQVSMGRVSIAQYTVLLSSTTLFTSILLSFFKTMGEINNNCKSIAFYRQYLDMVQKNSEISKSNALPEPVLDFTNEKICFENVSFVYPNTSQYILKNVNLEIGHGEKIGIVGLNGSGKTTLIQLLCRIYDPTEGRITLNGVDIRQIPYRAYCRHIGIVLQDFALFAYSVRENILFDQEANEEKLRDCIEKSGLTQKISKLPKGLETSVYKKLDNHGVEFSGGEGQKLAMARAIFKDADVLLLDEPTSALDPIAEYELFSRLDSISEGRTTLFISHRLSSTRMCDKIYVLSDNRIAEWGTHETLMELEGVYAKLFKMQAKHYEEGIVSHKNGMETPHSVHE